MKAIPSALCGASPRSCTPGSVSYSSRRKQEPGCAWPKPRHRTAQNEPQPGGHEPESFHDGGAEYQEERTDPAGSAPSSKVNSNAKETDCRSRPVHRLRPLRRGLSQSLRADRREVERDRPGPVLGVQLPGSDRRLPCSSDKLGGVGLSGMSRMRI